MRSFWTSGVSSAHTFAIAEVQPFSCSASLLEPILLARLMPFSAFVFQNTTASIPLLLSQRMPASQFCNSLYSQLPHCVRAPASHKLGNAAACSRNGAQKLTDSELEALLENAKDVMGIESVDGAAEEEIWRECIGGDEIEGLDKPLNEAIAKEDLLLERKPELSMAFRGASSDNSTEGLGKSITVDKIGVYIEQFQKEDRVEGAATKSVFQPSQKKTIETTVYEPQTSLSTSGLPVAEDNVEVSQLIINLDLKLYKAKRYKQTGQLAKAEQLLKQCIKIWPDDGRAYVTLGKLMSKCKRFHEARKVYEEGCQVFQGENAYIWQAWALLEVQTGNIGRGRQLFDAAIAADKKHAASWHAWAVLELRNGSVRKARSLIKKGLKFCAPNEYFYQTLACIAAKEGRYDQARSLFMKATQFNPKSAASWMAWGLLEMEHGVADTARQLFQRGIRASPKNRYIFQAWARFEAKEGNMSRARELFKQGVVLNPQDPVMLQSFGLFEYNCSNMAAARDLFIRASKVDPSHQPVWLAWGWMEWKEGNFVAARKLFQTSISVNSTNMNAVRAFQLWGVLEGGDGNPGKARALFKRALNIDSQNVPTWTSWVALEEQQGNAVRAEELRNIYYQQSTEVVDEAPWENLSEMLSPAIDSIKKFLKLGSASPLENKEYYSMGTMEQRETEANANWQSV
ncbi:hypothetical protein O6H91_19G022300 [Diphasiastrum complanatum]|uniref:Uncharacterized protein n=1 Tax=Diphasiastrum complanatum TaxID=34168 RepID=A0ACC2ATK2_DIPCM|nr:hypothetical protein O6H91_Y436400 [Diphasiastrum complanatum]KAJ7520769.1 hypothetical protein O6H91_19G022300 [Diphasiastrum complanatum]